MAEPKKKKSASRSDSSKNSKKLKANNIMLCLKCKQPIAPHMVCIYCGYYKNKSIKPLKKEIK